MTKTRQYILIAAIILLYAATIQCNSFFKSIALEKGREPDLIQNVFGGMRSFVGDWAFMKAEEYHHRGLPFVQAVENHEGKSALFEERSGVSEEKDHTVSSASSQGNFFSRIYKAVKITEESHLAPSEEKEVLPWFYSEVLLNPHDIRGYLLGGYWLERLGRYDESLKFLEEGDKQNPGSAQILTSIARIYFHDKNINEAISYLERARELWLRKEGTNAVMNQYMESDRIVTFDLLGYLYEDEGQYEKALQVYTELLNFQKIPALEEKIIKLKNMIKAVK